MLVNMTSLLNIADKYQFAVGSFNTPSLEAVRAVISAAELLNVPVIIAHAQVHNNIVPLETIGPIMLNAAKNAKVPVCVHLDHGNDIDFIYKAIDLGFTSVMFDGSNLIYEENVKYTCEVVKFAHSKMYQLKLS